VNETLKAGTRGNSGFRRGRKILQKMETDPGVVAAGVATELPPYGGLNTDFEIAGFTHSEHWNAHMAGCSGQLFRTLGARLLAGRFLTERDEDAKRHVVVINQLMRQNISAAGIRLDSNCSLRR
jgi:hypothetical protein